MGVPDRPPRRRARFVPFAVTGMMNKTAGQSFPFAVDNENLKPAEQVGL